MNADILWELYAALHGHSCHLNNFIVRALLPFPRNCVRGRGVFALRGYFVLFCIQLCSKGHEYKWILFMLLHLVTVDFIQQQQQQRIRPCSDDSTFIFHRDAAGIRLLCIYAYFCIVSNK